MFLFFKTKSSQIIFTIYYNFSKIFLGKSLELHKASAGESPVLRRRRGRIRKKRESKERKKEKRKKMVKKRRRKKK